ncbi:MAG TPA: putative metal-binding motif-containing protein [Solirubrobacter sp.]|nr:putative metal-binding motif-containing protein [Solirubrobacter sp.]
MPVTVPYQRLPRLRSLLLALAAGVVLAAAAAAPASAALLIVVPSLSGSGSVSGGNACTNGATVPNGTVTQCPATQIGIAGVDVPMVLVLTAVPQAQPAGHWTFVRWEGCPAPSGVTCTLVAAGAGIATFTPRAVFEDHTGPTATQPGVTYSTSTDRTVALAWSSNEPVKAAACSVDGGAFTPCASTTQQTLTLPEGTHTFRVRTTDISNNAGPISPTTTFRILDTAIVSGPGDFSNVKAPTFVFSSLTGLTFECALDTAAFTACGAKDTGNNRGSTALSGLADGVHTFRVRAKDGPELDRVPATRTWTVDTVAPTVALAPTSGPGEGALQAVNRETFSFSASEVVTFECRLDANAFAPCTSGVTVERLGAGAHRFEVRAIDRAGNVSAVAGRTWSVAVADNDNDGFNALIDCNDADPAIRPGAIEILDNDVDENCDGIVGTTPATAAPNTRVDQILVTLAFFSTAAKKSTRFTTLQVKNVPLGATVHVTCKGKGCPKGLTGKGYTKRNAFGTVTLAKFIKKPLRTGTAITVVVSKPNAISAVKILTVRAAKKPLITTRCQPPGAKRPVAC